MNYSEETKIKGFEKLQTLLKRVPPFCEEYFDYCSGTLNRSIKTMCGYATDLYVFFTFLIQANPDIKDMADISIETLNKLTPRDIQEYMSYLRSVKQNDAEARARKLSSLRSFMQYYFAFGGLLSNPAKLIDTPKIQLKRQPRLELEELKTLLDKIEKSSGRVFENRNVNFYASKTKNRDKAIIMMLAGTGLRVSELVGIDIKDINWDKNCVIVTRKGRNEDVVYFGEIIKTVLLDYINGERKQSNKISVEPSPALFLSSRTNSRGRLTPKSVERVVSKYANVVNPVKKITPHSLRRTFGTQYYEQTSDLYAVAQALGHKDIQVTKDHYAEISPKKKQQVKKFSDNLLSIEEKRE